MVSAKYSSLLPKRFEETKLEMELWIFYMKYAWCSYESVSILSMKYSLVEDCTSTPKITKKSLEIS